MSFRRSLLPAVSWTPQQLTAAMAGIGINFAATPAASPNIEDTLYLGSVEALATDDLRTLALLVTWLSLHSSRVHADRLGRIVAQEASDRVRSFFSAVAHFCSTDRRFTALERCYRGPRQDLLAVGTEFHLRRAGEDPRFAGSPLRVPANILRDRPQDVLCPVELARHHHAYRWRIIIGPGYRADMWAALETDPGLSAPELARRTYGSFATAWQVKRDFALLDRTENARLRVA